MPLHQSVYKVVMGHKYNPHNQDGMFTVFLFVEAEAKKTEDALFQKNNLQRKLRETEHSLQQKEEELRGLQQRFSTYSTDMMEQKIELDSLKERLEMVTVSF